MLQAGQFFFEHMFKASKIPTIYTFQFIKVKYLFENIYFPNIY